MIRSVFCLSFTVTVLGRPPSRCSTFVQSRTRSCFTCFYCLDGPRKISGTLLVHEEEHLTWASLKKIPGVVFLLLHRPPTASSTSTAHAHTHTRTPCFGWSSTSKQAVRVDPWDGLGSLSQPLSDAGPVLALACHPSRPIVAACLSDATICLWDYDSADGRGSGRFSGGGGGEAGGSDSFLGVGGAGAGMGSPPALSPPKGVRGPTKAGKDDK